MALREHMARRATAAVRFLVFALAATLLVGVDQASSKSDATTVPALPDRIWSVADGWEIPAEQDSITARVEDLPTRKLPPPSALVPEDRDEFGDVEPADVQLEVQRAHVEHPYGYTSIGFTSVSADDPPAIFVTFTSGSLDGSEGAYPAMSGSIDRDTEDEDDYDSGDTYTAMPLEATVRLTASTSVSWQEVRVDDESDLLFTVSRKGEPDVVIHGASRPRFSKSPLDIEELELLATWIIAHPETPG
jgi:hypothetical protein